MGAEYEQDNIINTSPEDEDAMLPEGYGADDDIFADPQKWTGERSDEGAGQSADGEDGKGDGISDKLSRRYRDALMLLLMTRICKHFALGLKPFTAHRLAVDTRLPDSLVDILLGELTDMQLLVEMSGEPNEEARYLPAIDIHRITVGMVTRPPSPMVTTLCRSVLTPWPRIAPRSWSTSP